MINLNHSGNSLHEITRATKDLAKKLVKEDEYCDLAFTLLLLNFLRRAENSAFILSLFLEPLTGIDFDKPSRIVEYIVNSIDGKSRKVIMRKISEITAAQRVEANVTVIHADNMEDALKQVADLEKGKK